MLPAQRPGSHWAVADPFLCSPPRHEWAPCHAMLSRSLGCRRALPSTQKLMGFPGCRPHVPTCSQAAWCHFVTRDPTGHTESRPDPQTESGHAQHGSLEAGLVLFQTTCSPSGVRLLEPGTLGQHSSLLFTWAHQGAWKPGASPQTRG